MKIPEIWDKEPVPARVQIAKDAGLPGKIGSSDWEHLQKADQESLIHHMQDVLGMRPAPTQIDEDRLPDPAPGAIEKFIEAVSMQDYLLWVGWTSYPTIKEFVKEANELGVSRRISKIPVGMVLGKTRVFLAHDEGETGDAVILGYYVPTKIELIVFDQTTEVEPKLKKIVTPVTLDEASVEPLRGCGRREDVDALYLISDGVVTFDKPRDYNDIIREDARRFRGIKKIDGETVMTGITKKEPSIRHRVKKADQMPKRRGDPWNQEEIDLLRDLTSKMRPRRAFRELHKITGRSILGMDYQYRKIRKEREDAE